MHDCVMATKTISLEIEAYEKLRRAKRFPRESFSEVVLRASIPGGGVTGRDLLATFDSGDSPFTSEALDVIDALNENDAPPDIP
jgi:peptidoglycan/xylan/chitin deacetylase (PgdA/CDA1 family)